MKPQKIIVKSASWEMVVNVDPSIFDDVFVEACTQALEINFKDKNTVVAPFMEASIKNGKELYIFNTYKILVNAGFHVYAENLRVNVKEKMKVDLRDEPIKG